MFKVEMDPAVPPAVVSMPVCCAKATWQNDRAKANWNAADLLVISFLQ
jgi:hypothetical protein